MNRRFPIHHALRSHPLPALRTRSKGAADECCQPQLFCELVKEMIDRA